tara:strand:+ start:607 stop:1002 length:396 start_codon:yes stop_codon:yes gene_type:complete
MSTYDTKKETIVHTERYKLTPDDESFRVMMITRTHDPESTEVPNVGYCTLKDIRGWVLKDIFYENTYFHDAIEDKIDEVESDTSFTVLLFENPKTKEQMQYCIQGDPEGNFAGYINQSYFNAKGEEERVNV